MKNNIILITKITTVFVIVGLFSGCSTIGRTGVSDSIDMGPEIKMNILILKDKTVSDRLAKKTIANIQNEFLQYGIIINTEIASWERPGFSHQDILRDLISRPLGKHDRMLALVGRSGKDYLYGLSMLPEAYGATETWTSTRGFAHVKISSLNQIVSFAFPQATVIHEVYRMLGIHKASSSQQECSETIARLKHAATNEFFPGINSNGYIFAEKAEVEAFLAKNLRAINSDREQENDKSNRKNQSRN